MNKILITSMLLAISTLGCQSGTLNGTTPPTPAQEAVFNVQTNQAPVVIVQTNVVVVTVTNTQNQVVLQTNTVEVLSTNFIPVYTYTPNANVAVGASAGAAVSNVISPGSGPLVALGITTIFGFLGWLFSHKTGSQQSAAASAMANEIETILEFINTLPSGASYTAAITSWLQSHQVQAGTATTILNILEQDVSNPDAKAAVATIIASLQATQGATIPAVPKAAPTS
jgi:hypothetical protein